jgi:hypothetical protein
MKRDLDLIRLLLLEIEKREEAFSSEDLTVNGYDSKQISYHIGLLRDAKFLDVSSEKQLPNGFKTYTIWAITFSGHDYLDAVRQSKIWQLVKDTAKQAGASLTVELAKGLAVQIASQLLGLAA